MNYKEMLDKLDFLEKKLGYLENENKHLKERVTKLEGSFWFNQPKPPGFTPGTIPDPGFWPNPNTVWCSTEVTSRQYGDH